jgi:methyltransferase family protein
MQIPRLRDIFRAHRGPVSDKWEQYIPVYESELRRYLERGEPVSLLEIGVQNGGSLEIWRATLPPHSRVVGIDVDERCRALELSDGIELLIGNAANKAFVDSALGESRFDIIIDDGSHLSRDVIGCFVILFPRVKPDGIYVVEDLHCSYWPSHGGGFRVAGSSIEWAKALVDALNFDHIQTSAGMSDEDVARLRVLNEEIARVCFFDSMLVVQKRDAPKRRPFARLLAGAEFPITGPLVWIQGLSTAALNDFTASPWALQNLKVSFEQHLKDFRRDREELTRERQDLKRQQQELDRERRDLQRQAESLRRQLELQDETLASLRRSTSWKVTGPLRYAGRILTAVRRRFFT